MVVAAEEVRRGLAVVAGIADREDAVAGHAKASLTGWRIGPCPTVVIQGS
ncbi:MAG: hypothetical protein WDN24_16485 [Sphingomonas sp.]